MLIGICGGCNGGCRGGRCGICSPTPSAGCTEEAGACPGCTRTVIIGGLVGGGNVGTGALLPIK